MWTFQTESRKKARKLVVERLMGSSPVWLSERSVKVNAGSFRLASFALRNPPPSRREALIRPVYLTGSR